MAKIARKTVEVGKMLKMVNTFLAAKYTSADERESMCLMMEAVKQATTKASVTWTLPILQMVQVHGAFTSQATQLQRTMMLR